MRTDDMAWRASISAWQAERQRSIAGEEGWITLVARAVLKQGENRIGGETSNDVVLPHAPARIGSIFLEGEQLRLEVAAGVPLTVDGQRVTAQPIVDDRAGKPTVMHLGGLVMHVIKRGTMLALRVKDRDSEARKHFAGLSYYPLDPKLRVRARLDPAPAHKTLPIINVLDQTEQMACPGTLRFTLDGVEYALVAVREQGEDELFILFSDQTAGHGTYPSGRFLYAPLPGPDGTTELDFNRAYSPPCGYTDFATCPLPPKQNRLARKIEAGERYEGQHAPPP
jgi:uncharacterized protein (DUF1684 family)